MKLEEEIVAVTSKLAQATKDLEIVGVEKLAGVGREKVLQSRVALRDKLDSLTRQDRSNSDIGNVARKNRDAQSKMTSLVGHLEKCSEVLYKYIRHLCGP